MTIKLIGGYNWFKDRFDRLNNPARILAFFKTAVKVCATERFEWEEEAWRS